MASRIALFQRGQGERLPAGTWLGKYQIVRHIGSGGYGDVYEAMHQSLRRRAAIKVIRREHARNSTVREQFLEEAQILAAIEDENVVKVYDYGASEDEPPWLAMELLTGETLQQLLVGEEPFPVVDALCIVQAVAHGLEVAHAHDVIHRDVKPANIFVTREGRVVLVDFGTAKALDEARKKQTHKIAGTAMYLAPERATSGPVDVRVDVYSLGLVLYELLTGVPAFPWPPNASPSEVVAMQIHDWPAKLEQVACWLADPKYRVVRDMVWRAIQKDPEKRTPSAHAFHEQCSLAIAELRSRASTNDAERWGRADARAALLLPDTQPHGLSAPPRLTEPEPATQPRRAQPKVAETRATPMVIAQRTARSLAASLQWTKWGPEVPLIWVLYSILFAVALAVAVAALSRPQQHTEASLPAAMGTATRPTRAPSPASHAAAQPQATPQPPAAPQPLAALQLQPVPEPPAGSQPHALPTSTQQSASEPPNRDSLAMEPMPNAPVHLSQAPKPVPQAVSAKPARQPGRTGGAKCDPMNYDCPLF